MAYITLFVMSVWLLLCFVKPFALTSIDHTCTRQKSSLVVVPHALRLSHTGTRIMMGRGGRAIQGKRCVVPILNV
ncbi:hypothetical protein BDF19DRAFT_456045 [Syncephalis fuscata]|nr:hypothetical protein BDF19DRAFT_456045 [Syncephalis fuscata]